MTKYFLLIPCFFISQQDIKASKINASTYGYNATDATVAFKNAINSANDTILVDFVGSGIWTVQPCDFSDLSNKTIIFQNNVQLVAKSAAFTNTGNCLFRLIRANHIVVLGYGATFRMLKSEYTTGEWRHTLSIVNSNNITVKGLNLQDSGGDGIYVSGELGFGTQLYSNNVYILDCICNNHRRQGMSVVSAQNVTVENCIFKNTIGTLPEAGLDLEPDYPAHRMVNVLFKNCQFRDNNGKGIELAFSHLDATSLPISVTFTDCYLTHNYTITNTYSPGEIGASSSCTNFPTGNVTFNNCTVENSQWSALTCRKQADSYLITFNNCSFKNVSQTLQNYNNPIWIEVCDYSNPNPAFGGIVFNNVCIEFTTQMPFMQVFGWSTSTGLKNVTGLLGVVNAYQLAPLLSNINTKNNVSYMWQQGCNGIVPIEYLIPLNGKSTHEGILLSWTTATEQNNAYFDIERSENGFDFITIGQIKSVNSFSQKPQTYTFLDKNTGNQSYYYRLRQVDNDGRFTYSSIIFIQNVNKKLVLYPNPTKGIVRIETDNPKPRRITLYNSIGQVVFTENNITESIDLQVLTNGIYWVKIGEYWAKIVKE